jgi:MoaA/NifB/PqqE/SkfB family radical SAM enzyme
MHKKLRKAFDYLSILSRITILRSAPATYSAFEIQPSSCNIMLTNRCNLKCMMCRQWKEEPKKELDTDEWKAIISDLNKNGIMNLHFTGGEPLLRKDLPELIKYANNLGFTVGMTTNGILLTDMIMTQLVEAGLRSIVISIDAVGSEYEKVRGVPNAFNRVKESAGLIAKAKKDKGIDASINFTLMNATISQFSNVKKLADELGLPVAICLLDDTSSIFKVDKNSNEFWITDPADLARLDALAGELKKTVLDDPGSLLINLPAIDYMKRYFREPLQRSIPCVSSQDRIIIDPYGNLFGGCLAMGVYGNVKERPFGLLRKDAKYKAAKRNMFYKKCPGCSCGYLFNIRCLPGLLLEDMAGRIVCRVRS